MLAVCCIPTGSACLGLYSNELYSFSINNVMCCHDCSVFCVVHNIPSLIQAHTVTVVFVGPATHLPHPPEHLQTSKIILQECQCLLFKENTVCSRGVVRLLLQLLRSELWL